MKYGINPDKIYSENDLDDDGRFCSRSQRDRLRKEKRFPYPGKVTPGRNGTPGAQLIEMLDQCFAEAQAKSGAAK